MAAPPYLYYTRDLDPPARLIDALAARLLALAPGGGVSFVIGPLVIRATRRATARAVAAMRDPVAAASDLFELRVEEHQPTDPQEESLWRRHRLPPAAISALTARVRERLALALARRQSCAPLLAQLWQQWQAGVHHITLPMLGLLLDQVQAAGGTIREAYVPGVAAGPAREFTIRDAAYAATVLLDGDIPHLARIAPVQTRCDCPWCRDAAAMGRAAPHVRLDPGGDDPAPPRLPRPDYYPSPAAAAAADRAEALLRAALTPEQAAAYAARASFEVPVGARRFRITRGRAFNVHELGADDRPIRQYCVVVRANVPLADQLLAQLLHLRHNPAAFFAVANRQDLTDADGRW